MDANDKYRIIVRGRRTTTLELSRGSVQRTLKNPDAPSPLIRRFESRGWRQTPTAMTISYRDLKASGAHLADG